MPRIISLWASLNPGAPDAAPLSRGFDGKNDPAGSNHLKRLIVAIAGAPGAGKSTLAASLCGDLNSQLGKTGQSGHSGTTAGDSEGNTASPVVILPMDGFHLDNAIIQPLGLLPRKGSPATFDVSGFAELLRRITELPCKPCEPTDSASGEASNPDVKDTAVDGIAIPVFDRELDLARAGASMIEQTHSIVLVEGNYLLLQCEPWSQLRVFFDLTVFLQVPAEVLEQRLVKRWLDHGHTDVQARARAERNDLPNAGLVVENSAEADLVISNY